MNVPFDRRRSDAGPDAEPLRVLVVEDHAGYRAYAALLARRAGFAVDAAADAAAALALTATARFDAVLIDQSIPEMTGVELIQQLRGNEETKGVYAVMLSGDDRMANKLEALRAGFDDFIPKSLPEVEILAKLSAACRVAARQRTMDATIRELYGLAAHDELTGLFNRRFFVSEVERLLARGAVVNVLLFDLDGFKQVNDTYGHLAGDRVLKDVGASLQANTRPQDIVARFGGDEFVMAIPDLDVEEIEQITSRLARGVESQLWTEGDGAFSLGVSSGIASSRLLVQPTLAALLDAADHDMYKNKFLRKNPHTRLLGAIPGRRPQSDEVRFVWPAPRIGPGVTPAEPAKPERKTQSLEDGSARPPEPPPTR